MQQQGVSVALSADGNTAIVGGPEDGDFAGAAWVFARNAGVWTQQGKLVGTGAVGLHVEQGYSVALSADGSTAIIGGRADSGGAGAAWVFTRNGGGWMQQGGKLVGTGAVGSARQGNSVAMSADGNTAIVGGDRDNGDFGAAWVFTRSAGVWSQQGEKLVGTGGGGYQGSAVALSADGNTAIVGGTTDNADTGAAWVFTRCGGGWTQQGDKLVGTGAVGPHVYQGSSVALSGAGSTAIVGGFGDDNYTGAAWVFTRSGGGWTQQGDKLVGTGAAGGAEQGRSVGLSAEGNMAIVGGPEDALSKGAAWTFTRSGGLWAQEGAKLTGPGATGAARQGYSVSLSADGKTAIFGGYSDNSYTGAAWVFMRVCPTAGDANGDGATNVSDVFFLINHLFAGGPGPGPGCS